MSNAVPKVTANVRQIFQKIVIRGLPTAVTSGDVRRAVNLAEVRGVSDVSLIYRRFMPTGNAVLSFAGTGPDLPAVLASKKITFSGSEKISTAVFYDREVPGRLRGVKGRHDALNRGLCGDGASAGFPIGTTVTVTGLPGRMTIHMFKRYLQGFQLANETNSVMLAPRSPGTFTMFARFVVMLASESEAQRLVRKLHFTPFGNDSPPRYITAAVIY